MVATPKDVTLANGDVVYRVNFRLVPGGNPTTETFDDIEEAWKFSELVDRVGGARARKIRDASDRSGKSLPTVREMLETHLTRLEGSATPGTIDDYRRVANRTWMERLGGLPIDQVTADDVAEWVAWQRQQKTRRGGKYSSKSIKNAHAILSAMYQVEMGQRKPIVKYNPAKGAALPSDDETREMTIITPNDFVKLIEQVPEQWRSLVALLYGTGMRWGEATAVTAADFDLDGTPPTVRVSRAWKEGKGGSRYLGSPKSKRGRRTVHLPPELVTLMREKIEEVPRGELWRALDGEKNLSSNYFRRHIWKPALEASGLTIRPRLYDLRHSHASWLLAKGEPVHVVQRRLGHEDARTTLNVYAHLMPDAAQQVASTSSEALAQAFPQIEAAPPALES